MSREQSNSASIAVQDVTAALGLSRNDRVEGLLAAIGRRAAGEALRVVQEAVDDGKTHVSSIGNFLPICDCCL